MTRLNNTRKSSKFDYPNKPSLSELPEAILREVAFALEMTRRVKESMTMDKKQFGPATGKAALPLKG